MITSVKRVRFYLMGAFISKSFASKAWRWFTVGVIAPSIVFGFIHSAQAGPSTTLTNISRPVFDCIRRHNSNSQGRISYSGGDSGEATAFGKVFWGEIFGGKIRYSYNQKQSKFALELIQGPATLAQISNGLDDTATKCRNGQLK